MIRRIISCIEIFLITGWIHVISMCIFGAAFAIQASRGLAPTVDLVWYLWLWACIGAMWGLAASYARVGAGAPLRVHVNSVVIGAELGICIGGFVYFLPINFNPLLLPWFIMFTAFVVCVAAFFGTVRGKRRGK